MENKYELINNQERRQYEFHVESYVPKIEYIINRSGDIYLIHTEVPRVLGGRGIGTLLVEQTLEDIQSNGMKVVPVCPFVAAYMKKNPKWMGIAAEDINIR